MDEIKAGLTETKLLVMSQKINYDYSQLTLFDIKCLTKGNSLGNQAIVIKVPANYSQAYGSFTPEPIGCVSVLNDSMRTDLKQRNKSYYTKYVELCWSPIGMSGSVFV